MQNYSSWQNQFLYNRLKIGRLLAIGAVMGHLAVDIVVHPGLLPELLTARVVAATLLALTWTMDQTAYGRANAHIILILMIWSINFPLIYTTVILGGFDSTYYLGIVSVTIGAAAMFPSRWRVHALAQAITLVAYCAAIFLLVSPVNFVQAFENVFVLVGVFLLSNLSVYFYQQQHQEAYLLAKNLEVAHNKLVAKEASKTAYFLKIRDRLTKPIQGIIDQDTKGDSLLETNKIDLIEVRSILRDLIEKSYIESGSFKIKLSNFSVVDLIYDLEHVYSGTCTFEFSNQIGAMRSDRRRVRQILENIILFLQSSDKAQIDIRIARITKQAGDHIEVIFSQAGVGLAPEQRTAIFLPYHLSDGSPSGLGLPLAREIARELGGDLQVMGELGREARFRVEIPCEQDAGLFIAGH